MRIRTVGREVISADGQQRTLEYGITVGDMYDEFGKFCGETYGVRVRMHGGAEEECAQVSNLTTRPGEIFAFLELLRRNTVTPVTLKDVCVDSLPLSQLTEEPPRVELAG